MSDMKIPNIKTYTCSDGFVTDNEQVAKSHEINIKNKKLLCPFCQQELHQDPDGYYTCYTDNCGCWANGGNGASGSESLWLALIRTRKALEIIKKEMSKETMPDFAVIRDALKGVGDE